jgi:hypothetical protein
LGCISEPHHHYLKRRQRQFNRPEAPLTIIQCRSPSLAGTQTPGEAFFKSLVERVEKNAGQESNRTRGTKIEWTLPDSVNGCRARLMGGHWGLSAALRGCPGPCGNRAQAQQQNGTQLPQSQDSLLVFRAHIPAEKRARFPRRVSAGMRFSRPLQRQNQHSNISHNHVGTKAECLRH